MNKNKVLTDPKPTLLITGFLGSGKTSYLNYLLKESSDLRFAIIENEYGQESIDSDIVLSAEDDIIELNNGCLCCTLNDNLYDILNKLYVRRKEYDQLIIEATGMADPRGLAAPFLTNPSVKKQFPLKAIICLVDAELIEDQLSDTIEAIHQITYSDILLLNKADTVSKKYLSKLTMKLKELNPLAKIMIGNNGEFSIPNKPLKKNHYATLDLSQNNESKEAFPISTPNNQHKHHHTDVVSHTFVFHEPFDLQKLCLRLTAFLMFQSENLYRMKGVICSEQSDSVHLIQSVGKRLSIDPLQKPDFNNQSKIIIIGKNLERSGFEKMFNQCKHINHAN